MNYLQTLMRYKAWANELVFAAAAQLPQAELTSPRKIVFGSMLRTLNHVYAMDEVWRAHLEGRPHGYTTRNPEACPPLAELRHAQKAIDGWFVQYADSLSREDEIVDFQFIGGGPGAMTRRDILLHVANHGTYHRGNVAAMMYQAGVAPPTTDLPVFLRRLSRES
ncbi:MAG TPA: DinB family protein [Burkholderiales bacterium]|nr:DinB family protein [Burkholderiales bacterium]